MRYFNKRVSILYIIIIGFIFFFIDYVNHIEVIENYQFEFYKNGKNITRDFEARGVSYFNASHQLENENGVVKKKDGYFKYIQFKSVQNETIDLKISLHGKSSIQTIRIKNNLYIWKSNELTFFQKVSFVYNYFSNKVVNFINGLNWFVKCIFGLGFAYILLVFFLIKKKHTVIFKRSIPLSTLAEIFLFSLIVIIALCLRFSSGLFTIVSFDFEGHLGFVAKFLNTGNFYHYEFSYVYPTFVLFVLGIFKNFNALVYVQHIMAVASVALLFFTVRIYFFANVNYVISSFSKVIFIFVIQLILFNQSLIFYEKNFHHEGTLIFYFSILIIMLVLYFNAVTLKKKKTFFVLLLFILMIGTLLHYRFTVGLYVTLLIVAIHHIFFLRKNGLKYTKPLLLVFALYLIIQVPEYLLIQKYEKTNKAFPYKQFFFSNAYAIQQALKDGHYVEVDFDRTVLKHGVDQVLDQQDTTHFSFPILGYNFDFLKYKLVDIELGKYLISKDYKIDSLHLERLRKMIINRDEKVATALNNYYTKWCKILILNYPELILYKIAHQYKTFFFSDKINFSMPYYEGFYCNKHILDFMEESHLLLDEYKLSSKPVYFSLPRPPSFWSKWINCIISPFIFLILLVNFFMIVFKKISMVNLICTVIVFCTICTIALLHTFDISRYSETMLPFVLSMFFFTAIDILGVIYSRQPRN